MGSYHFQKVSKSIDEFHEVRQEAITLITENYLNTIRSYFPEAEDYRTIKMIVLDLVREVEDIYKLK